MGNAKIEVVLGEVSFKGEGREEWLEKQLDKVLGRAGSAEDAASEVTDDKIDIVKSEEKDNSNEAVKVQIIEEEQSDSIETVEDDGEEPAAQTDTDEEVKDDTGAAQAGGAEKGQTVSGEEVQEEGEEAAQTESEEEAQEASGETVQTDSPEENEGDTGEQPKIKPSDVKMQPLETFLQSQDAGKNQVNKFLATAVWITLNGNKKLRSSDITKVLKENNLSELGNASACLSRNVLKGYCKKRKREFTVTDEGLKVLGVEA